MLPDTGDGDTSITKNLAGLPSSPKIPPTACRTSPGAYPAPLEYTTKSDA